MPPHLPLLLSLLLTVSAEDSRDTCAEDTCPLDTCPDSTDTEDGGVEDTCPLDTCPDSDGDVEWEEEAVWPQLRSWLAQQRAPRQLGLCRHEADPRPLATTAVPLFRCRGANIFTRHYKYFPGTPRVPV